MKLLITLSILMKLAECCSENIFVMKDLCDGVGCEKNSWCHSGNCQENLCVPRDNTKMIAGLIIFAVILLIIGVVIWNRNNNKKQLKKELEALREAAENDEDQDERA